MRSLTSNPIVARFTALMMSVAVISSTTPVSAVMLRAGGFGGGTHTGFHGGFRPGVVGVHPGFRPGFVGFHPGFRPGFVGFHPGFAGFHHPYFHQVVNGGWGGYVNGAWVSGWGAYDSGCWEYRPAYDAWGNFLGQQSINLCQQ